MVSVSQRDGGLLLVELEDLNPYLSLNLLQPAVREAFVDALVGTLHEALGSPVAVPSVVSSTQTQDQA